VEITVDGLTNNQVGPIILEDEAKWERDVNFIPSETGDNQKIEFLLYKDKQDTPYLTLNIWLNVTSDED
jgi:uncharacterized membrane protein